MQKLDGRSWTRSALEVIGSESCGQQDQRSTQTLTAGCDRMGAGGGKERGM